MNTKLITLIVVTALMLLSACAPQLAPQATSETTPTGESPIGMPNPASVYCEQQGGKVDIRTDQAGNQTGFCVFPDGSECDEWAYYRGECKPGNTSSDAVPPAPTRDSTDVPDEQNVVANIAKDMLAQKLSLKTDDILLAGMEKVSWPDGCLGLPEKDTACTMMIVPGYRITLSVGDKQYFFRSDKTGENVRQEPEAADKAKAALAEQLGIPQTDIKLFGAEVVDWPDGCLGLPKAGEACTDGIVPGYRLTLEANKIRYIFRSDMTGDTLRQEVSQNQ